MYCLEFVFALVFRASAQPMIDILPPITEGYYQPVPYYEGLSRNAHDAEGNYSVESRPRP